jgi:ribosomal protein S6--L-glutamate ligase
MRVGILSRNSTLYSTRRLVQAVQERDHTVWVIDTLRMAAGLRAKPFRRALLPGVAAIIPRIGASITMPGLAVVRRFEAAGVVTTASSQAIAQSRDKRHSLQLMSQAGLPVPRTVVVRQKADIEQAVAAVGGLPVVVKLSQGTQGRGVLLVSSQYGLTSIFEAMRPYREALLVQEYIAEAEGRDTRIIVVGGRCVAAMVRSAAPGNFRSNLHQGGTAVPVEPDGQSQALAVQAAQTLGLGVGGVDILQSARGPLLLEVNSSPGLEGIERTTGVDVAREIVTYLEGLARSMHLANPSKSG